MKEQKRGKNVAIGGAILQAIITIVAVIIWRLTNSQSAMTLIWLLLGGLPLWLMSAVLFYARQLENQENMELQEIAERGQGGEDFFAERGQLELRPARQRLAFMQRWMVPIFSLLMAAYNGVLGVMVFSALCWPAETNVTKDAYAITNGAPGAIFSLLIGFGMFLFSRYCVGMSSRSEWRLLRATGSYLQMCALATGALAVALMFASMNNMSVDSTVKLILPLVMVVFAIELVLNFLMDIYRPRRPGDEYRPSYDSRLFNLIAEPGRVGHSITDTINYQFGFEVSKTWFYQLVSRAIVPLIVFAVLVIIGLTSVVIVNNGEQYVVKHWGQISSEHRLLQPGLRFKWPWPIATAQRFDTGKVHEIILGVGDKNEPKLTKDGRELILWTEEHGYGAHKERDFLIGVPPRERTESKVVEAGKAPSVSIIKLVVVMQYKIVDAYKYAYNFTDAAKMLECVADQEMVQYCASASLDQAISDNTDRPQAIMTFGRLAAAKNLKERIQKKVDEIGLGVKLEFVGIVSAHPPAEAVPQFEKVLEAERLQDEQRYKAQAEANKILAEVSGDPGDAMELFLALRKSEVFDELSKLKSNSATFDSSVSEFIRQADEQIKALKLEIHREKLLGKKDVELADRIALQKSYADFRQALKAAADKREAFDYAGQISQADKAVNKLFDMLEGEPAKLVAEAQAYRWQRELQEQTALESYRRMLLPYRAAPRVYMFDRYMDVMDETLPGMQKYVIGVDPNRLEIRLDLKEQADSLSGALEAGTSQE